MTRTREQELIKRFRIELVEHKGQDAIQYSDYLYTPKKSEIEEMKALKQSIITELKAQETAKAEKAAKIAAEKAAEKEALLNGENIITAQWHDGEYLSAWEVFGQAAELLEGIGACKYISGWGYEVDSKLIDALGKEFTLAQAKEFTQPAQDAKAAAKAKKEEERKAKFEEAKRTEKPVELRSWMADCNDPTESCDVDYVVEWAMPDGTVKTTRQHTW